MIPQYYECTDGTAIYRFGVRNLAYVVDRTITSLGFLGVEDTDWENLKELTIT